MHCSATLIGQQPVVSTLTEISHDADAVATTGCASRKRRIMFSETLTQ
jgi:hypothetical protein